MSALEHVYPHFDIGSYCIPSIDVPIIPQTVSVKVPLHMTLRHFTIKTVEKSSELARALKLRYEVFHQEMIGDDRLYGSDVDEFDDVADHLIIVDNRYDSVIGTYRLISSAYSRMFYSGTEFDISSFLATPGIKLELSRACIDKRYRNGLTLSLLWKGIIAYAKETQAKHLCGCSSIWVSGPSEMPEVVRYLEQKDAFSDEFTVRPKPNYQPVFSLECHEQGDADAENQQAEIPAILKSYLKAGAKLGALPAFDRSFRCHDFFTVLDLATVTGAYERKYL